jgi:MYXO-CTERM domain-containing protein
MLALPAFAQASVVTITGNNLVAETSGQVVTFLITGTDAYVAVDWVSSINGGVGPAPAVELVFNDPAAAIPGANLAGSVWAGGSAGINLPPAGTTADSSGLSTGGSLQQAGAASTTAEGVFLTLTVSTVGVPAGDYILSFDGTVLNNGLDPDTFEPIVVPLQMGPFLLSIPVIPEPSSIVLGLFAAAGLAAVVVRRRRAA